MNGFLKRFPLATKEAPFFVCPLPSVSSVVRGAVSVRGRGRDRGGLPGDRGQLFYGLDVLAQAVHKLPVPCVRRQADTWEATRPYWRISFPLITRTSPRLVSACWLIQRIPPQWHLIDNVKCRADWLGRILMFFYGDAVLRFAKLL